MKMSRFLFLVTLVLLAGLVVTSCTTYKSQQTSFKAPSAYSNMQVLNGAEIAAKSYFDSEEAEKVFGFDIRSTGLLPIQLVVDNAGKDEISIVPDQTFLIDAEGNMWNLLKSRAAYERLEKSTEYSRIAKGSGKGAMFGAASGALIGAAIGILTGENVGTAALGGAAIGGAGGATIGGVKGATDEDAGRQISRDLTNRSLQNKTISGGSLAHGFLFFPGEAPSAKTLRLQILEVGSGETHTSFFTLE